MDHFAFLLPVILCAFGLTFLFVGRHEPRSAPWWGVGYLSAALGFIMPILPETIPGPFRSVVADTLFLLALSFYGQGLLGQFRRHLPVWPRALLVVTGMLASVVSTFILENPTLALAANDLVTSLCFVVPAFAVMRHARGAAERLLVAIVFLLVADSLVRNIVMTVLNRNPSDFETFLLSPYAFLMQTTSTVIGILLALAALGCVTLEVIDRYKDVAERDPLTGLLNRRGFDRLSGQKTIAGAVIVCDIDHFKRVNDRYGHAAGDAVITELARILALEQAQGTVLARFGGEEFVLFLPGIALHTALPVAHAMHARIGSADWSRIGVGAVTASFGVAASRGGDLGIYDVMARADRALYAAKTAGRNRVFTEGERPAELRAAAARAVA
ncbi:diguanylate cyclase (GGDEF)-like protein [Rhizobium sp. PP-F2F-G36]|nr:diguanylate cyclase (GGDEF)-like protein [Rhizobium sp. PP-F2F-G36]